MVTSPNRAPEMLPDTPEETAGGFLERMMSRFNGPPANDNRAPDALHLATRHERLNQTEAEGSWLRRNVIGWFTTRTETRSELHTHSQEIGQDLERTRQGMADIVAVWEDDRELGRRIDQYERYNRRYGDQARRVVEAQLEGLDGTGEEETPVLGVIDEDTPPAERERIEAAQAEEEERRRIRDEAVERWGRFAVQQSPGGRWRSRRLTESVLSWDNIKENWRDRGNFFDFFRRMGADYAQWKAVKAMVPTVNVMSYGARAGQEIIERYRETGEIIAEGAEIALEIRGTQREIQREGAEAVVLVSETARSDYIRSQMMRLLRGEISREQLLTSTRLAFRRFQQQDPQEFARMIRGYGLTARQLNTRAGFYELFKNAALWYTPWGDRGERTFWEANETAIPIWGSYAAWRDINVDNGLPLWTRIGFASVGTLLDVGTVASLGLLSPVIAGAKAVTVRGGTALARRMTAGGARIAAAQTTRRLGQLSLSEMLGQLPRAARTAVTTRGAGTFAAGAAGYTALSAGIDWLFDIEDRVVDAALMAAETAIGQDLSYQQRRLLRVIGRDAEPVLREAYNDYREREASPETAVAQAEVEPELTPGQIAEDEARREQA